jgi:WD40 repeat protein
VTDPNYKAFVSYSHQSDERLAASLQSSLSRFAKPWYRLRTMRIFQDKASLSASPALWNSIEEALGHSEYFLLLASRASAESRWVQQELHWWIQNRSVSKLIICLTDGEILWDNQAGDFDWEKTNAISPNLKGIFPAEPLYADFRSPKATGRWSDSDPAYRGALLEVAAPLLGRPKDELDGEDIRLHRRAKRTAWGIAVFIVLLAMTATASFHMARQRLKIAASRALASEAVSHLNDRSLSLLLSIESRRIAYTVESRRSLLATIQRLPNVEAFLWGHSDAVSKAVFSPDGKTVMSAGWDDRIVFWSAATHRPIGLPVNAGKGLVSVAFNSDGSQFASSSDGSVVVWDTASRKPARPPFTAKEQFVHVGFSPTRKLIAASTDAYGGHPSKVYVWNIATHQLMGNPIPGSSFAFDPQEKLLAISQYEKLILYDLRSHSIVHRPLPGLTKTIDSIAFSWDGTLVAAGSEDGSIAVWEVQGEKLLGTLVGHQSAVNILLFDQEGQVLFSGSQNGSIIVWDLQNFKTIDTPVQSVGASISSIYLAPDGTLRSLALDKNQVILLHVTGDPPLGFRMKAPDSSGSNIAFSPDGRFLASSGEFGGVVLWDVATGKQSGAPFSGHERQVSSLAFTPDGKQLISGAMDGTVIFWDVTTRLPLAPPDKAFNSPVWSLACSPDERTIAAAGDARIVLWNLYTHKHMEPPITSQKDRIWTLAFSPSGDVLASAGNSLGVTIWNMRRQATFVKTLGSAATGKDGEVMPVGAAFSPDGALLASSAAGHSVALWKVKSGQPIAPVLYGHTQAVQSVAFSSDGKLLASGSADGDIRLWDVETHELLGILGAHETAVNGVVFEKHQNLLASVGTDDSITLWDMDLGSWEHRACRIANRNLTRTEWSTYLGKSPYRKTCPDF